MVAFCESVDVDVALFCEESGAGAYTPSHFRST